MRKLMKKKVSLLGKEVSVFAIVAIAMVTLASAGLVGYLSNELEADVTVVSPVILEVSTNGNDWTTAVTGTVDLVLDNVYGGEYVTFWVRDTNLADVAIVGSSTKLITCVDGVTCGDFTSIMANGNDLLLLAGGCVQIDPKTVDLSAYTSGGLAANGEAGYTATNEITATFQQNAVGTYVFTMQKMSGD